MKRTGRLMAIGGMVVLLALFFVSAQVLGASPEVQITYPDERVFVKETDTTLTVEFVHTSLEGYLATATVQLIRSGATAPVLNDRLVLGQGTGEPVEVQHDLSFTAPLEEGKYTVRVRLYNILGPDRQSAEDSEELVYADYTPPAVALQVTVSDPGDPTGRTGDRRPEWTWTGTDDVSGIAYFVVERWDKPAFQTNEQTFKPANDLGGGVYVLRVMAVDYAGNESEWAEASVIVDATAPPVPGMPQVLDESGTPLIVTKSKTPVWTWPEIDDEDEDFSHYKVYLDGVYIDTTTSNTFTSPELDDSLHMLEVTSVDRFGNESGKSIPGHIVVDTKAPTVTEVEITTDPDKPLVGSRTRDTRPKWEWDGEDEGSGVAYYIVTLNGQRVLETSDTWFRPESPLAEGEYELKVWAVDNVGNEGNEENEGEVAVFDVVIIDTTPPPVPGMPTTDSPTNDTTPTWTWAWDAESEPDDFSHFNVYLNDEKVAEVDGNSYTVPDALKLNHGLHVLQVTAVDDLGNESEKSAQGHVQVDTVAPEIPTMDPMPEFSKLGDITFSWSAASDDLRVDYVFRYSVDGGSTWTDKTIMAQSYTIPEEELTDGATVLGRVQAVDEVGNTRGFSDEVQVIIDDTGPVTEFTAPTADVRTNHTQYLWTWESTDAGIGVVVGYWVNLDDQPEFYVTEPKYIPQVLLPGDHRVTVRAVDALGNREEPKVSPVVTVVEPVVIRVTPSPETYTINQISTIAFEVAGMIDADFVIAIGDRVITGDPEHGWRVVEISKTEAYSKYYLLLDGELLRPGQLLINVRAGLLSAQYIYDVLNERSGFGFGRLRPW